MIIAYVSQFNIICEKITRLYSHTNLDNPELDLLNKYYSVAREFVNAIEEKETERLVDRVSLFVCGVCPPFCPSLDSRINSILVDEKIHVN